MNSRLKYMVHAAAAITIAVAAFFSTGMVHADNAPVQVSVSPELYVTGVTTDKASYAVGDTVHGTMDLYNGSSLSLGAFSYSLIVGRGFDEAGNPGVVFDEKQGETLSMGPNERKTVSFTYLIPGNVTGSDVKIHVQTLLPSGLMLGSWMSPAFAVTGGKKMLTTANAYIQLVQADGKVFPKSFPVSAGVPIDKAERPEARLSVRLLNSTGETVSLTPTVRIFDRVIQGGTQVFEKKLDPISVTTAYKKSAYPIDFSLPNLDYKPGTYEGELEFKDSDGVVRSEAVDFRYVIKGPMAIIHSVVSDARNVISGQPFGISVAVTGEPMDLFFASTATTSNSVSIQAQVSDDRGKEVASSSIDAVIGSDLSNVTVPMLAESDASSLRVSVQVRSKSTGAILATYQEQLSKPLETPLNQGGFMQRHGMLVLVLIFLALAAVIGAVIYFRISKPITLLCFALLSGAGASVAHAQYMGYITITYYDNMSYSDAVSHTPNGGVYIYFDSPGTNYTYAGGSSLHIQGHSQYYACLNSTYTNSVRLNTGGGQYVDQSFGTDSTSGTYDLTTTWRYQSYFAHTFTAPTTGGSHTATLTFYKDQEIFSSGPSAQIKSYKIAYQPYTVKALSTAKVVLFDDLNKNGTMDSGELAINEASACGTTSTSTWSYPGPANTAFAGIISFFGVTGAATAATSTAKLCQTVTGPSGGSIILPDASYSINPLTSTNWTVGVSTSSLPTGSYGDTLWIRTTPDFAINTTSVPDIGTGGKTYIYYFGIALQPDLLVNGACNAATEASPSIAAPSQASLCTAGSSTAVVTSGSTRTWNCDGTGSPTAGTTDSCSQSLCDPASSDPSYCPAINTCISSGSSCDVAPQCGNPGYSTVSPTSNLCNPGTSSLVSDYGSYFGWTCTGVNGNSSSTFCPQQKCSAAAGQTYCTTGPDAGTCASTCGMTVTPPGTPVATTTLMANFTVDPKIVRATTTSCSSQWNLTTNDGSGISCSLDGAVVSSSTATTRSLDFKVGIHTVTCTADNAIQSTTTKCSLVPHYSNE